MAAPRPLKLTALLFTPGNRPDRFAKAAASGADGIIIDLEDAVPFADKERVRAEVVAWLRKEGRVGGPDFVNSVRVNSLRTSHGRADLDALYAAKLPLDAVMLPKVESAAEVQLAAGRLPEGIRLVCLIETVPGVRFVAEIASASPRVAALAFGGLDLSAETGGEPTWDALLYPRTKVVHACAAAGLAPLDQPCVDFRDAAGLAAECGRVRSLGFTGKLAIHPDQCAAIRAAFQPTPKQIEQARRIVSAYEAAGGKVVTVDDRMIDVPLYRAAQRVIQRAGA
jgi:(S)-citramalyl-CoA lyase